MPRGQQGQAYTHTDIPRPLMLAKSRIRRLTCSCQRRTAGTQLASHQTRNSKSAKAPVDNLRVEEHCHGDDLNWSIPHQIPESPALLRGLSSDEGLCFGDGRRDGGVPPVCWLWQRLLEEAYGEDDADKGDHARDEAGWRQLRTQWRTHARGMGSAGRGQTSRTWWEIARRGERGFRRESFWSSAMYSFLTHPTMAPIVQVRPYIANASVELLSSVRSPRLARTTATFPQSAPERHLMTIIIQNLVERPLQVSGVSLPDSQ